MSILLTGGTLLTCDPDGRIFRGDLLLRGDRIAVVGDVSPRQFPSGDTFQALDVSDCLVLPGFVQPHVHLCQTLFRGLAEELPLLEWLQRRIWPLEAAHDEESLRASAQLGIAELLLGGTTTILDMGTVHHTDVLFETAREMGIRYIGGKAMMDAPNPAVPEDLRETTGASVDESAALRRRWHETSEGRLRYAHAPRFVLSCTKDLFAELARLSREEGVQVHTHASENREECAIVRSQCGADNIEYFHRIGLASERLIMAHGVQSTEAEIDLLSASHAAIVHCPSSNLKLASGIAPIPEMLQRGVRVGIAADGAPCNNNLDALLELRLAALLHRLRHGATAISARTILDLGTRRGAELLGLGGQTGSLEEGKKADVIVLRPRGPYALPGADPLHQLIFSMSSRDVEHVFVDGQQLVKHGRLNRTDLPLVIENASEAQGKLLARARIS